MTMNDLIGSISFGIHHRGLDYWITVIDHNEIYDGHYQALAGYVEVDTGQLDPSRPADQVLDYVARVVADDDERVFKRLAAEYPAEFSEHIADEMDRRRQADGDAHFYDYHYEGGQPCEI